MSTSGIQQNQQWSYGDDGADRIADNNPHVAGQGAHTDVQYWRFVEPVDGNTVPTFEGDCVVKNGDVPSAGDELKETGLSLPFTTLHFQNAATNPVWAYPVRVK